MYIYLIIILSIVYLWFAALTCALLIMYKTHDRIIAATVPNWLLILFGLFWPLTYSFGVIDVWIKSKRRRRNV